MSHKTIWIAVLIVIAGTLAFAQNDTGVITAKPVYKTITADGNIDDWKGIDPVCTDSADDGGLYYDFAAAYLANDKNNLYIRITFTTPQPYGSYFWYMNTAFNADQDTATGHGWKIPFGSEFNIQGTQVFDQRCGSWVCIDGEPGDDNGWGTFAYATVAPMDSTNVKDIEIALPRNLVYKNLPDGKPGLSNPDETPLFITDTFTILFETQDENYQSVEFMPNPDPDTQEAGVIYTFAQPPVSVTMWDVY